MKRREVIDLTDETALAAKRQRIIQWIPPIGYTRTIWDFNNVIRGTDSKIILLGAFLFPSADDPPTYHINIWLDGRYANKKMVFLDNEKPINHLVYDLVFEKTLEIYATQEIAKFDDLFKLRTSTNTIYAPTPYARDMTDLLPISLIFHLANPEIIKKWIRKYADNKLICTAFQLMFARYAFKPNVITPSKFN